ncbi:hypothetical protein T310_7226 [Rasamsonia emersonii CBS 393.64]|uniref:Uncharacterized protein n=1 Tax=Rasamsonia emersonii (strain ATCC 16479 / CBS 393.64 / IMI 116815) TaxID=1408163 RepID=A0A0F4YKJ7_RASE3|nr:hypothetical protein T310_7226 [Rasamsonia emersonii CBS 393.64]KKA18817.1 hypothetical protein T310_7226 [Rasamsonia emersonii CBS 393.64]
MASPEDSSKVNSPTKREQDALVKPRKDDKMSRIPRASGHKESSTGSIKSPRKPTTPQTPRSSLLPLPVRANHGLTPKKPTSASHTLSSNALKDPVPEDETVSTSIEPDNAKDANEKDENKKDDDNIKDETEEDSWPEDTDPKFLAEAAEYRRRGPVFTGEYRVKRLTRSRLEMGPTLFIAPSAERLIMGTDDEKDVSSSISVDQKLEEKTVSHPFAEGSRVFDQQTATRDNRWSPQEEQLPSHVTSDTAVGGNNEQTMETGSSLEQLYEHSVPYVRESREGEDKGKGREKGVSTDIKSQYRGPAARDDEWPARIHSSSTLQDFSEGQGPADQVMADIKSQFQGVATRHDGWPVRIDSLPSFQKLSEGHSDEGLSEQVKTDIKSQLQGPAFKGWPLRKDSLPDFRRSSEAHKDEGAGFYANLHPSPSVASRSSKNPISSASRIGRLTRVFSQSPSSNLPPTAKFRSRNNPLLPKSFTETNVKRRSISSVLVPETPKKVKASPKKRAVEEIKSPTTSSTMKFPSSKLPRALDGVRGFLSQSKTAKKDEAQPADKKKPTTSKKMSISSPQTPTMESKMSQEKQRGLSSAHASVSTPQSVSSGSRSRTKGWSFARPTFSTRQRAAANTAAKEAPSPSSLGSPSVASPPQNPTGPITKPTGDLWDTLVERSPRREIPVYESMPLDWDPKEDPSLPPVPEPVADRHVEAVRKYIKRLRDMAPEGVDPEVMADRITASNFLERGVEALLELQRGVAEAQRLAATLQFQQVVARRALFRRFREVRAELDIDED